MLLNREKMTPEQVNRWRTVKNLGWLSDSVVEAQKSRKWIVKDFLAANSVAWLYGAPGSYKSFIALDLAMHVATGRPWQGRETDSGVVLFVAAEGGDDIHIRRAGWEVFHNDTGPLVIEAIRPQVDEVRSGDTGLVRPGFNLLRNKITEIQEPVLQKIKRIDRRLQLDSIPDKEEALLYQKSTGLEHLQEEIMEGETQLPDLNVRLVVIDTYSQTAADDTKDAVGRYTKALYDLLGQHMEDAAILVIDHTTKGGDTWMGSQAKLGNVDMMAEVDAKGDVATLSMKGGRGKIKGAAPFDDIHLQMIGQEIGAADAYGRPLRTLVCTDGRKAKRLAELADGDSAAGTLLALLEESGSLARDDLKAVYGNHKSTSGKKADSISRTFRRALNSLMDDGLIAEVDNLISPT